MSHFSIFQTGFTAGIIADVYNRRYKRVGVAQVSKLHKREKTCSEIDKVERFHGFKTSSVFAKKSFTWALIRAALEPQSSFEDTFEVHIPEISN